MQLPEEFKRLAEASIGKEAFVSFCAQYEAQKGNGVTSIRVNPLKASGLADSSYTNDPGNRAVPFKETTRVPWCSNGYYLAERPSFTLDPLFHSGAYYVQEASSMYMELAAKAIEQVWSNSLDYNTPNNNSEKFFNNGINALDLCAAPGGKSTHLLSILNQNSLLVSNEVINSRAVVLADNIAKWGADNAVVTNNDPADFKSFDEYFHLIVVDAPCSGEGLFIKEPQAINEWSLANVNLCAQRQQRILADIWHTLKPGGFLIYSTCTYNKFENDGNLVFLSEEFGAEIIDIPLPDSCNSTEASGSPDTINCRILKTAAGGVQFVPGLVEGEGQFMAVVRKPVDVNNARFLGCMAATDGAKDRRVKENRNSIAKGNKKQQDIFVSEKECNYLSGEKYILTINGDLIKGYRKELYQRIKFIESNLRCVLSGVAVANQKGKDFIPHADLALQSCFAEWTHQNTLSAKIVAGASYPFKIAAIEVTKDDALKFLAKEPLVLKDAPLGYILLTYNGLGIGFLKNIGNRTNNLLPMARRIRMDIH